MSHFVGEALRFPDEAKIREVLEPVLKGFSEEQKKKIQAALVSYFADQNKTSLDLFIKVAAAFRNENDSKIQDAAFNALKSCAEKPKGSNWGLSRSAHLFPN